MQVVVVIIVALAATVVVALAAVVVAADTVASEFSGRLNFHFKFDACVFRSVLHLSK